MRRVACALTASIALMFGALTSASAGCYGECNGYQDDYGALWRCLPRAGYRSATFGCIRDGYSEAPAYSSGPVYSNGPVSSNGPVYANGPAYSERIVLLRGRCALSHHLL